MPAVLHPQTGSSGNSPDRVMPPGVGARTYPRAVRAATAMLANAAEVREGLLYVLGGGIEQLWVAELPTEVAPTVIVSLELDPDDLGKPFQPHLLVRDSGGEALVDVDMPPAVPEREIGGDDGAPLFPMVFTVGMQVLREGGHELSLTVDGVELASLRFSVRLAG
jgi:hypothetical protein